MTLSIFTNVNNKIRKNTQNYICCLFKLKPRVVVANFGCLNWEGTTQ